MHPSLTNPFLRGFQDLRYERVLQISYADDCPPCYRALHPAQNELPNEAITLQPCLFDEDVAVLYQIMGNQLGRSMHIGDLGNVEAAQNLIEQLSFATGHYSRSWEISSAHLPADDFEYLQVRAWCNSPASFFECFELNVSHAVGCKLYSTPWVADIKAGGSSCSAD